MASVNNLCHLCEEEGVSNIADVWCADCENFLCKDCKRHHGRSKASKDHQTIALDEYKKLPSFIVNIKSRCEKHDEKYDFYCKFHSDPCCVKCIKDKHKDCRDLAPLGEIIRDIKTSAKISNLDKEFNILLANFETVVKFLKFRTATLHENKTESLNEIRSLRASINKHLDKIEKEIVVDLSSEFDRIKLQSDHLTTEIEDGKKVIHNLQNDLSKMTMYATNLQMFVGMQYLEVSISKEVEYLNKLQRKGQLDEIRLESKLSSDLKCLTNSIKSFGTTVVHSSQCTLQFDTSGEYQVNLSVPIDSIEPKRKAMFKVPKCFDEQINGCQILPDGRILILDTRSQSLLLFEKDGKYTENVISFKDEANDFCYIKGNLIAVTFHAEKKIMLIDLSIKKITKTIKVAHSCYGIDSKEETLIVIILGSHQSLLKLDLQGNILSQFKVQGARSIRLALCKDSIVFTDWRDNLIACYSNEGVLLWTYIHKDICEPLGITLDKHGFIYIASKSNNKIVVLSGDGKKSKTILTCDNEIAEPLAINIDKSSSTLLVTNSNGTAFVYEI